MTADFATVTAQAAIDQVVEELLEIAGVESPPIDPLRIAARLRIQVAVDEHQPTRGRAKKLAGQPAIFLKPDERPERVAWAAAHELGELMAWRVDRVLQGSADIGRESIANQFASRLLLPSTWFLTEANRLDGDLPVLKRMFPTASHELIAMRLLDLETPAVISVFDQNKLVRRRSSHEGRTPYLQPIEQKAQEESHREGRSIARECSGLRTQAWAIHEPGWKREILRTTQREE